MAKVSHGMHQWSRWLAHFPLGKALLAEESRALAPLLLPLYGKNALLIGVPEQGLLLNSSKAACQFMLGPLVNHQISLNYIEAELQELPIHSGSADIVIVPHTFEYLDNPQHLISEACRIVKPEGHIFILGFNPFSFWGLRKGHWVSASQIKSWLALSDFELEQHKMLLFRPPFNNIKIFHHLKFLEWLGKRCYKPWGGVYLLQAKAKVIPLSPIKMHWKQELTGVIISPNMLPGGTTRNIS